MVQTFSVSSTYSKEIASLAKFSLLTSLSILMPTPIPTNRTITGTFIYYTVWIAKVFTLSHIFVSYCFFMFM